MSVATPDQRAEAVQLADSLGTGSAGSSPTLPSIRDRQNANSPSTGTWSLGLSQPRTSRWTITSFEPVGGLRRQQQVVDADAVVAVPAEGLEVPEGVARARRVTARMRVGQAEIEQRPEALEALGPEQRVAHPASRDAWRRCRRE